MTKYVTEASEAMKGKHPGSLENHLSAFSHCESSAGLDDGSIVDFQKCWAPRTAEDPMSSASNETAAHLLFW